MVKNCKKIKVWAVVFVFLFAFLADCRSTVYADDEVEATNSSDTAEGIGGTHISISPVSETFQLSSSSVYDKTFTVSNDGADNMEIEVYAAPYSYTYSEEQDSYQLGFNRENNFTQITRWISFKDLGGSYVENPKFTISPGSSLEIAYRITTPDNIPAGGQYAVIFAHTLTGAAGVNGIVTEAAPGIIIYGRSTEGEVTTDTEISNLKIGLEELKSESGEEKSGKFGYRASGKVKNNGNVDATAIGTLTVSSLFGKKIYETEAMGGSTVSIIPESEREVADTWQDLPGFGIYNLEWTITVNGNTQTSTSVAFINMMPVLIIAILLLTLLIVWIIIMLRKRKERRSRLAI